MRSRLYCFFLLIAIPVSVLGQPPSNRYERLKLVLDLTDSLMAQLQAISPAAMATKQAQSLGGQPDSRIMHAERRMGQTIIPRNAARDLLNDSQKAKLDEIEDSVKLYDVGSGAVVLGLIESQQWPGSTMCRYPVNYYASVLDLTESQVQQFEKLQAAARAPLESQAKVLESSLQDLFNSGTQADSPEVKQVMAQAVELHDKIVTASPSRDLARSILYESQRVKLAALEIQWELANEAMDLGLILDRRGSGSEVFCK